jgi:diguanylate cyclase (GGDEF)-like protein
VDSAAKSKPRVLIVEDSVTNLTLLTNAIADEYDLSTAASGPEGLRLAASLPAPELILLDIVMSDMSGYDVCRILKANVATRDIPVIFLTGRTEVEDEALGLEIGAVDYIRKPFSSAVVKARMRTHLELKRHRDLFEKMSSQDGLTGIANRRHFDTVYDREWKRAQRGKIPLSVIMTDIDFFKKYNDHYGHIAGDDCIKRVATLLATTTRRATDLVARYGGEEFVSILVDTDDGGVTAVAETMRAGIEDMAIAHADSEVAEHVTISIGTATMTPTLESPPGELTRRADLALYAAKRAGRNRVVAHRD